MRWLLHKQFTERHPSAVSTTILASLLFLLFLFPASASASAALVGPLVLGGIWQLSTKRRSGAERLTA